MPASRPTRLSTSSLVVDGQELTVDGRVLCVRVSTRRSKLGLTVERDGSLILRAPGACETARAETFVRDSRRWIDDKLRLRDELRPVHPVRSFTDGETYRYLGREYRLLLVDEPGEPVRLSAGRLRLDKATATDVEAARRAVTGWYQRAGTKWAEGRLQPWAARMDVSEPEVTVRDVGRRWGTYRTGGTQGGEMALHWAVFQLPSPLVNYVIAHELAHIRVAGHGPDYWRLLRRAIPECGQLKAELDEMGRRVWLGDVPQSIGVRRSGANGE
ncbi:M48 family metallopeptidase [Streptomyces sp. NBC_00059]|uniref:M48 family metallopeptidase n=1 Tax=Streptomyces sp. NBC_00059 TaxID=2975635 RepID=UPI002253C819|nr:SprT family zinc-dependent metalloprotease [Streptomyces sp. NBC_00059]MCX5410621.1 M48 family metallopeptidase [Streptomyces sp. NBC_00059]